MPHWADKITEGGEEIQQQLVGEGDHLVIHSQQDVSRILDDNQRLRSQGQNAGTHGGIAARVPVLFYYTIWPEEFKKKYGWHPKRPPAHMNRRDSEKMWRDFFVSKLHEREFSKFRIDERRFTASG